VGYTNQVLTIQENKHENKFLSNTPTQKLALQLSGIRSTSTQIKTGSLYLKTFI
jgi:hypothetical protein